MRHPKKLKNTLYQKIFLLFFIISSASIITAKNIDSLKTITIPNSPEINKIGLNYEQTYPEFNALDNFKKTNSFLFCERFKFIVNY